MNDRRINDLVRMALEVEELEDSVTHPPLRLVGDDAPARRISHSGRNWFVGIGLAAAAGLALVFALPALTPSAPTKPETTTIAHADPKSSPAPLTTEPRIVRTASVPAPSQSDIANAIDRIDPGSVERCIVLAIYRDARGSMHCVKSQTQEWSNHKRLSEISPAELKCVTVGQPCTPSADRALLVAMAGPQRSLPRTDADAVKIATCILGSPCENDSKCFAHAAAECVPSDVAVKIESATDPR